MSECLKGTNIPILKMNNYIDWKDDSTLYIILEVEKTIGEVVKNKGIARLLTVLSLSWMREWSLP